MKRTLVQGNIANVLSLSMLIAKVQGIAVRKGDAFRTKLTLGSWVKRVFFLVLIKVRSCSLGAGEVRVSIYNCLNRD